MGRRHCLIELCLAESCRGKGASRLAQVLQTRLGIAMGGTTPDGFVTLAAVQCIGLCNGGPCGVVAGRSVSRLTEAKLVAALNDSQTNGAPF